MAQKNPYDFVQAHDPGCRSEFDADFFQFDSEHCSHCRAEVERRKAKNAEPVTEADLALIKEMLS